MYQYQCEALSRRPIFAMNIVYSTNDKKYIYYMDLRDVYKSSYPGAGLQSQRVSAGLAEQVLYIPFHRKSAGSAGVYCDIVRGEDYFRIKRHFDDCRVSAIH